MRINLVRTKLIVVPDNSTPSSEGRLCLQLPVPSNEQLSSLDPDHWVGTKWAVSGSWATAMVFTQSPDGKTVSPRSQLWWKNGVRDHGIRRNYWVDLYIISRDLMVAALVMPTDDIPPALPPTQMVLFG